MSTPAERQNSRKNFAERVRRLPGESHRHSVFAFFLRARSVRKNVLFSEFLVSHTTSRRRLPQTVSYSSAHSSASPFPVGTLFLRRREPIAWFTLLFQCCSGDRRDPTDTVVGQVDDIRFLFKDWCLVVTVQTTVEVPQLLGVPVEIPQVQFLDKFDTLVTHASVVCSSTRWSMSLLCCAMGFRRCSQ